MLMLSMVFLWITRGCSNNAKNTGGEGDTPEVWTIEKATDWHTGQPWWRGSDFIPGTAINQLEFWQEETFDPETIDRELGWAQDIGFNCMRVYLHHLAWEVDKDGFKSRLGKYLDIADSHGIRTIFVFFDDCWNSKYHAGKQPEPKTGVHNSGWVQDPGDSLYDASGNVKEEMVNLLGTYVKDVMTTLKDDQRVLAWDLYNEPGNSNKGNKSMYLLQKIFGWAREVSPSQPVTAGLWNEALTDLNLYQVSHSDIITYHNYSDENLHQEAIDSLKTYGRPLICTEYMARTRGSRFDNIMPLLKKNGVGAINWGLVAGKTNTMYAWDTPMPGGTEPPVWFHDIFRKDGTPYDPAEIEIIKKLTGS